MFDGILKVARNVAIRNVGLIMFVLNLLLATIQTVRTSMFLLASVVLIVAFLFGSLPLPRSW